MRIRFKCEYMSSNNASLQLLRPLKWQLMVFQERFPRLWQDFLWKYIYVFGFRPFLLSFVVLSFSLLNVTSHCLFHRALLSLISFFIWKLKAVTTLTICFEKCSVILKILVLLKLLVRHDLIFKILVLFWIFPVFVTVFLFSRSVVIHKFHLICS